MFSGLVIAFFVIARIAAAGWANVGQKQVLTRTACSPLRLLVATWGWMTLLTVPWWLGSFQLGERFWFWLTIASLFEVPGNWLLLRSLRQTDLSIYGPLNSFKPVISLVIAFVLFGEAPSFIGLVGVSIVLLGTAWLTAPSLHIVEVERVSPPRHRPGVRDRIVAVALTAAASVFLKQAMAEASQGQVLAAWCFQGWVFGGVLLLLESRLSAKHMWRASRAERTAESYSEAAQVPVPSDARLSQGPVFQIAVSTLLMQAFTIGLFAQFPVGYALALFQLGSIVSVYLGHRLFGEPDLVRRLLASGVMVCGALVILLAA